MATIPTNVLRVPPEDWCLDHPEDPKCQIYTNGGGGINENRHEGVRWKVLTPPEKEHFVAELAQFQQTLPDDPVQRQLALAQFYETRGMLGLKIEALSQAIAVSGTTPNLAAAMDLADTLRTVGFHELAIDAYNVIQQQLPRTGIESGVMLGRVLQSQARSFELLGRIQEADRLFVLSQHMLTRLDAR